MPAKPYKKQKYKCAICGKTPQENGRKLVYDHDHLTGIGRGLLCSKCNSMIGFAEDRIRILKKAIKYLRKWKKL